MPRKNNSGGFQPGGGRPPGPDFTRRKTSSVALIEAPDEPTVPEPSPTPPEVRVALGWLARGLSINAICVRMHKDHRTVKAWIDQYPEVIEAEIRSILDPRELMAPLIPDAVQAYAKTLLQADDKGARLRAATDVLDRIYGKPVIRQAIDVHERITIVFEDAEDGE